MHRRRSHGHVYLAVAAVTLLVGVGAIAWLLPSPRTHAKPVSSASSVVISPDTGLVGTHVMISIHPDPAVTATGTYTIGSTTTEPTGQACADPQPIEGLEPLAVPPGGAETALDWPASLDGGPYWLCATPTDGASGLPGYRSYEPFTVVGGTNPMPTPISVTITTPVAKIRPGTMLTIEVAHWQGYRGADPTRVNLLTTDPATPVDRGTSNVYATLNASIVSQDGQGTYTLTAALPDPLFAGTFWLEITDALTPAYSAPFVVISPTPTPAPQATPTSSPGGGGSPDTSSTNTIIIAALVALLAVLAGVFTVTRLRKL